MSKSTVSKTLRSCAFATLLSATGAAALLPDWATPLRAQNYAGYVDLHLDLTASDREARAGGSLKVVATVYNGGPADAHEVRNDTVLGPGGLSVRTFGCFSDPIGYPVCIFLAPLAADSSVQEVLMIDVSPRARGRLTLQMFTSADEPEAYPGQETAALVLPIVAHANLRVQTQCVRALLMRARPLHCYAEMSNAGPATALEPELQIDLSGAAPQGMTCTGACPASAASIGVWRVAELAAGDSLRVDFEVELPPAYASEQWQWSATAVNRVGEIDDAPGDNQRTFPAAVSLFADGFDGTPN